MEEFICKGKLSSLTLESVQSDSVSSDQKDEQRLFVAKLFYDHTGLLIRRQETRKIIFFHYNDQNLLEKEVELRETEKISREKSCVYSAGRLIEEISGHDKVTYHYNSRDILNYTTSWNGDIQESVCSYGYDDAGLVILKEIRDSEGGLLRSCRMKRNRQGLISEEMIINQDNYVLEHNRYEYPVFHGENWLKRNCYRLEEGREPVLTEILYRNISMASSAAEEISSLQSTPPEPQEEESDQTPSAAEPAPVEEPFSPMEKTLKFSNGLYKGLVNSDNQPEGQGEFWGSDGSRYSGGFTAGKMSGKGNLLHKNGSSYTGEFSDGLPQGKGECLWPDGSRYRGEFDRGEMHGIGSFTWSDGTRFTGLFEHNRSTDQGLLENAALPDTGDTKENIQ